MKLDGKIAIVTGGAMGNGLGIVKVFSKYGAKVSIFDYSDKIFETVENFKKEGYEVEGYKVDIRNTFQIKEAVNKVIERYGQVDVLVNNAGVAKLTPFLETTDEIRDYHFDINIKGAWNMSKEVLPYMKNGSAIVNLSSVTGTMVADTGEVAYATTKAALLGFTKGLAAEVVEKGIRVNAILPGYIMTPMVEGIAKDSNNQNPDSVVDGIAKGIPMKRLETIEELGELAAFLASSEASYLTGQSYVIDGGSTLPETMSVGI